MGTSDNAYRMLIDSGFLRQNGEFFDAYKILSVSQDAPEEEIEDVFKNLKMLYESKEKTILSAPEQIVKDIYLAHTILVKHRQAYDIEYNKRKKKAECLKAFYKDGKFVDFYEMLGVTKFATDGELRAAYKRILEENRAMYSDNNDETQNKEQRIKDAQIALEILLDDSSLRATYDEEYSKQQTTNSANGGAKSTSEMSFEELMGIDFSSSRRQDEKGKKEKKDLKMGENNMNSEFYVDREFIDLYGTLGIESTSTKEEISAALEDLFKKTNSNFTEDKSSDALMVLDFMFIADKVDAILLHDEETRKRYDVEYAKMTSQLTENNTFNYLEGITLKTIPESSQDVAPENVNPSGKMTQEKIESLLGAMYSNTAPAPESVQGQTGPSGKMTKEEIDAMLAGMETVALEFGPAPEPAPAPGTAPGTAPAPAITQGVNQRQFGPGLKMTKEELESMYASMKAYASKSESASESATDQDVNPENVHPSRKMTEEEMKSMMIKMGYYIPEASNSGTDEVNNPTFYREDGAFRELYDELSIKPDATIEEIKEAFNLSTSNIQIKEDDSPEAKEQKRSNLIQLAEAYDILTNNRDVYDAERDKEIERKYNLLYKPDDEKRTEDLLNSVHVTEEDFINLALGSLYDFYTILGVPRYATIEEVTASYNAIVEENKFYHYDDANLTEKKARKLEDARIAYLILTGDLREKYDQRIKSVPRYKRKNDDIHNVLSQSEIDDLIADMKDRGEIPDVQQANPSHDSVNEANFYSSNGEFINFYTILGVSLYSPVEEITAAIDGLTKENQITDDDSVEIKNEKTEMQKYLRLASSILCGPLSKEYDNRLIEKINKRLDEIEVSESDFYYNKLGGLNDFYKLLGIDKDSDKETIIEAFADKYIEFSINPTDNINIRDFKSYNLNNVLKAYKILTGSLRNVYDGKYDAAIKNEETEQKNMERERIENELASLRVTKGNFWTNGVFNDFYQILSIAREATPDVIKYVFEREINKTIIAPSDTPEQQAAKRDIRIRLMVAYKVLTGSLKGEYDVIYDTFKEIYEEFEGFDISMDDLYDGVYLRNLYNELRIPDASSAEEITQAFEREIYNQVITVDDEALKNSNKKRLMQAYVVLANEDLKNSYLGLIEAQENMIKHINDSINTLRQSVTESDFYDNGKYGTGNLKDLYALLGVSQDVSPAELEESLVGKFKEVIIYSDDDEVTRNRKQAEQIELLKTYIILSGPLKAAYDEEVTKTHNKGGNGMGTGTDEEKRYEEAEARAREAFNAAQKARLAGLKAKLEKEAEKLKAESDAAAKAAEAAKAARESAQDSLKDAKDAAKELKKSAKEAKKEAKRKKREEKKALKKAKKVEKNAEKKIKRAEKKRTVLIRERMGGRLTSAIHAVGSHWKGIVAGVTVTAFVTGAGFGVYHLVKNHLDKEDDNETQRPGYSSRKDKDQEPTNSGENDGNIVYMDDEELDDAVRIVHKNWNDLGLGYTEEEIAELVKCVQNRESQVDVDTANEMMTEAVNSSYIAAISNITSGEHVFDVSEVDLSTLLSENDAAIDAVCNMEDYLNAMLTDTDSIEDVAKDALEDEVRVIVLGETVDGFNANTSSPAAKLIWARLVSGINSLTGVLGEDFTIEVDGTTYTQSEISNSMSIQSIINAAKSEMGVEAKTMSMNNNN